MIKEILGAIAILILFIAFLFSLITMSDIGFGAILKKIRDTIFPAKYTSDYKEGKPCITFDFFISLYNVNPERWYLRDYGNSIGYKEEDWRLYGTDVYWKTRQDRKKYFKWLKGELRRQADEETAKLLTMMSQNGLEDIEKLKQKIHSTTAAELERIDKEKQKHEYTYEQILENAGYKLNEQGRWVKK